MPLVHHHSKPGSRRKAWYKNKQGGRCALEPVEPECRMFLPLAGTKGF